MKPKATRRRMISCFAQIINGYVLGYRIPELVKDETIKLTGVNTRESYPDLLRRVTAHVEINGKWHDLVFLTDNFEWAASTISELYKARWQVELGIAMIGIGGADIGFSLTVLFLCSPLFFKQFSCFYDSLQCSPSCVLENSYTVFGSMLIQDFIFHFRFDPVSPPQVPLSLYSDNGRRPINAIICRAPSFAFT